LERPDSIVQTKRARSTNRGEGERLMSAECVVLASDTTVHEYGESSFVEDVHPVIASDRIGAYSNGDSGGDHRQQRCDAVTKLRVGRRTVRDRAAAPRDRRDIAFIEADAVNEQRA